MADSKITALTSIGASTDPANDPLVLVDVSDTSMAASGTTKKVTLNQLLGASGTATLASATITGALTAGGNSVIGTGSAQNAAANRGNLTIGGTSSAILNLSIGSGDTGYFLHDGTSISFFNRVAGGSLIFGANSTEQMRLNSTGLGVGGSPSYKVSAIGTTNNQVILHVGNTAGSVDGDTTNVVRFAAGSGANALWANARYDGFSHAWRCNSTTTEAMVLNSSGNVGVGVTPSAWGSNSKALQVGGGSASVSSTGAGSTASRFAHCAYFDNTNWLYQYTGVGPALYQVTGANAGSTHAWYIAPGGTAGNAITFTQAMTLDASGNLLVGTTGLPSSNGRISASSSSSVAPIRAYTSAGDIYPSIIADKSSTTNTTAQVFVAFTVNNQATGSGQINANGASQAAFGTFSDSRLKENIVSLPSQLANILSLRPVEFDYKDGSGHQIGFVAQEIQEVYSDAVGEQNGFLTVTGWSKTEARLVSAIKELAAKVQALEAKLA